MSLELFPEILAGFSFLSVGFGFYYIVHYPIHITGTAIITEDLTYGSLLVTIVCAAIVGSIQTAIKISKRKYIFDNFYYLMIGMAAFVIGGGLMTIAKATSPPDVLNLRWGFYATAAGIGITYVPALSYINFRSKSSRSIMTALAHFWLLLGFAIGCVMQTELLNKFTKTSVSLIGPIIDTTVSYGYAMIAFSLFTFILYAILEIIEHAQADYTYKMSLDVDLDQENNYGDIMNKKYFIIGDRSPTLYGQNQEPYIRSSSGKSLLRIVFLIASRISTLTILYPLFLWINLNVSQINIVTVDEYVPYVAYFLAVVGILVSTAFLKVFEAKWGFLISCVLKIIALVVVTAVIGFSGFRAEETKIVFWIAYFCFGFAYSHPDINILELVSFKLNELILTVAFVCEMVVLGVILYLFHYDPAKIIPLEFFNGPHLLILDHSIAFVIILFIVGIGAGFFLIPTKGLSLLEIKNRLVGLQFAPKQHQPAHNQYDQYPRNYGNPMQQQYNQYPSSPPENYPRNFQNSHQQYPPPVEYQPQQPYVIPPPERSRPNRHPEDPRPDYPQYPSNPSQQSTARQTPEYSRPVKYQSSQPLARTNSTNYPQNTLEYDWNQVQPVAVLPRPKIGGSTTSSMYRS